MKQETKKTSSQLKTWLWTKPIIFTIFFLGLGLLVSLVYSALHTFLNFETPKTMFFLGLATFVCSVWYMIKKLPRHEIPQKDLIAIANGATLIALVSTFVAFCIVPDNSSLQAQMLTMYLSHSAAFSTIAVLLLLFISMYLLGVAISGVYAKYKRCKTMGIAPWKIILSMPFAFFMLWTPGYLIKDKKSSNLEIKCKWYANFTNWVVSNSNNTLLVFLTLLFFKTLITGTITAILSLALLIIYTLWYIKYKSDLVKNINKGYALTAVGINLAIILAIISQIHF